MNETLLGNPELDETEKNLSDFLEFSKRIESGENEINSRILMESYEQGRISKDELGSLALELLKKIEPRAKKAGIDELTGLNNLMGFNEKLGETVKELRFTPENKRQTPLQSIMVIALDMNFLKILNDTYGHEAGNKGLTALTDRLRESVKEKDVIARVGGDEFLVLMPIESDADGDAEEIHAKIFERLKLAINDLTIDIKDRAGQTINYPIFTAAGYSVLDKSNTEKTAEELRNEADAAMYENKQEMKGNR